MRMIDDTPGAPPQCVVNNGDDEVLYESGRTGVSRACVGGTPVILKHPLGGNAGARRDHERGILERLAGLEGVVQLADVPPSIAPDAIVLQDNAAPTLAEVLLAADRDPDAVIELGLGLALAVGRIHRHHVVHKDINPANILVPSPGAPVLVDFGLASTNALELPGFVHQNEIVGTLPYLAPEQTGRTGRPVDHRADLYAVGATLYETATGRPPFGSDD